MRTKDVSLPSNELLEEKLSFVSKKNESLVLENNRLNTKVSLLSGQIFELIKSFKRKLLDFTSFAVQESESAKRFKEGVIEDMRVYTEKVRGEV